MEIEFWVPANNSETTVSKHFQLDTGDCLVLYCLLESADLSRDEAIMVSRHFLLLTWLRPLLTILKQKTVRVYNEQFAPILHGFHRK